MNKKFTRLDTQLLQYMNYLAFEKNYTFQNHFENIILICI